GPLVDCAIVVLENTHRHRSLGASHFRAAFNGSAEVAAPVLVATLTTFIVLCPIALMSGMGGFLFRPLTLAVAFPMMASFSLSLTLVPMLCAKWLGDSSPLSEEYSSHGWGHQHIQRCITSQYERLLRVALRHRVAVLGLVVLLFGGALALNSRIGRE